LHCNYFSPITLDALCAQSGLKCLGGELVDIFGGSILRRYAPGAAKVAEQPQSLTDVASCVQRYQDKLANLADQLPAGTVGYGAAERTAAILGFGPALVNRLEKIYDGNPLLAGRFLAGTQLRIEDKTSLYQNPPRAIVLFALSNINEIVAEWKRHLPPETLIAIPSGDFSIRPLSEFP
jgi:hypothetical protein